MMILRIESLLYIKKASYQHFNFSAEKSLLSSNAES